MAKIGDEIRIELSGPVVLANTATTSGFSSSPDQGPFIVSGKIAGEEKENWLIELDTPLVGNNQILIPKSTVVEI